MKIINNTQIEGTRNELIEYFKNELIRDLKINTNHDLIIDNLEMAKTVIEELNKLTHNNYVLMECNSMNYWSIKKNQLVKFEESNDGLVYVGDHGTYELLKGITSNGLNSDIVFLVKRVMDKNNVETKVLDFLYGGFSSDNIEYFESLIEQHELECDNIEKREIPLF